LFFIFAFASTIVSQTTTNLEEPPLTVVPKFYIKNLKAPWIVSVLLNKHDEKVSTAYCADYKATLDMEKSTIAISITYGLKDTIDMATVTNKYHYDNNNHTVLIHDDNDPNKDLLVVKSSEVTKVLVQRDGSYGFVLTVSYDAPDSKHVAALLPASKAKELFKFSQHFKNRCHSRFLLGHDV